MKETSFCQVRQDEARAARRAQAYSTVPRASATKDWRAYRAFGPPGGEKSGLAAIAIDDAAPRQIVGGELDIYAVAGEDADAVLAKLAGDLGQNGVLVVELDAKNAAGMFLDDRSLNLDTFFFHIPLFLLRKLAGSVDPRRYWRFPPASVYA